MDFKRLIGRTVVHKGIKSFGIGTIVDVVNLAGEVYIKVEFDIGVKTFPLAVFDQHFRSDDEDTRNLIMAAIQEIQDAKKAADEARRLAEEAAAQARIAAAEQAAQEADEASAIRRAQNNRVNLLERRAAGQRGIFLVCQNANFDSEVRSGFIWAPADTISSHIEMVCVEKDDIIFHHFGNQIHAISIAKGSYSLKEITDTQHTHYGQIGRSVDVSYHIPIHPVDTRRFITQRAQYGSMTYGPFDRNGDNNQGCYLSELHPTLATIFIDAAIAANPKDTVLLSIKKDI